MLEKRRLGQQITDLHVKLIGQRLDNRESVECDVSVLDLAQVAGAELARARLAGRRRFCDFRFVGLFTPSR